MTGDVGTVIVNGSRDVSDEDRKRLRVREPVLYRDYFEYLFGMPILPRCRPQMLGPAVSVTLAFEADEHGGRRVRVPLRITPDVVLADPKIERVVRHERLDATPAFRAAVIER